MTDVPFQKLFWADFFGDPLVRSLDGETAAIYLLLIGRMWMNGGWLPDNDALIARQLDVPTLRWKMRYRPKLTPLLTHRDMSEVAGGILTQKRVEKDWQLTNGLVKRNKAALAKARAEKHAKSMQHPFEAEREKPPAAEPAAEPATVPAAVPVTEHIPEPDKKGGPTAREVAGAGRPSAPTVNGDASRSGGMAETPVPPSDPALVQRLVSAGTHGRSTTPMMDAARAKLGEARPKGTSLSERIDAAMKAKEEDDDGTHHG